MTRLRIILVRFTQFIFLAFFTYVVLLYLGLLLLIPLAVFIHFYHLFEALGANGLLAGLFALAAVGGLGHVLSNLPELFGIIMDVGISLVDTAVNHIRRFSDVVDSLKGSVKIEEDAASTPS